VVADGEQHAVDDSQDFLFLRGVGAGCRRVGCGGGALAATVVQAEVATSRRRNKGYAHRIILAWPARSAGSEASTGHAPAARALCHGWISLTQSHIVASLSHVFALLGEPTECRNRFRT